MIKAVIFDMDGLLIDSEPIWQEAEVEIFQKVGVPLTLEMTRQTTGLRVDEVVDYWHRRYPWQRISKIEIADQIDRRGIKLVKKDGKALPGVAEAIKLCVSNNLPIALASSSSLLLIDTVINKFEIAQDISVICSALDEPYGKPHPAVFLTALDKLNRVFDIDLHAEQCLVFEDSINGVIAAKAAKMKCIAVPQIELLDDKRLGIADKVLESLVGFTPKVLGSFSSS